MTPNLRSKPRFYRTAPTNSRAVKVDRSGGRFGAGVIRDVSLVTAGEALGHEEWLDATFVEQVAQAAQAAEGSGVKSRFTHPSLSADGLGRFMGRIHDLRVQGDQAIGDIHFAESAHETPDGDLASYVMGLAEEDPEAFAMSIVFEQDQGAMSRFRAQHEDEDGNFTSPDPANTNNFPHARLSELHAADFVDEPAANPGGLFHRGHEIADEADRLCAFALGLSDKKPALSLLDADPERIQAFARRFLDNHDLVLEPKKMADDKKASDDNKAPEYATKEQFDALSKSVQELTEAVTNPKQKADEGPEQLSQEQVRRDEAKRCRELYALAKNSGLSDWQTKAEEWADKGLSLLEAKGQIADLAIAGNGLTDDAGESDPDPHAAFRKEFRAGKEEFAKFGIEDEDAYVRTRCRDEGLPVPEIKKAS